MAIVAEGKGQYVAALKGNHHTFYSEVDEYFTEERRLFISSVKDAELCAEAIRGHWSVENRLHWHPDFSFGDDDDMTTDKNAYQNFSVFRRMALTLCKMAQPFIKWSIKDIRWGIGLEPKSGLGRILGTLDETHLETALRNANVKKSK